MNEIKITVFTPTYNRDKYICNLYNSLCIQSNKSFEWVVVDQGNDTTEQIIHEFEKEAPFPIVYKRLTKERGISRAFNLMLEIARGYLVMKVDDDDTLTSNATEVILEYEQTIVDKEYYAGVSGLRQYPDGRGIGGEWCHNSEFFDCTNLERKKFGLDGDKAEAYYLDILKKYGPMPTVPGEYYTWEGILWDRIAHAGKKIRWFNKKIYCTEYLPGGATDKRIEAKHSNFFTYTILVSERMRYQEVPVISRFILSCRYFELLREKKISFRIIEGQFRKSMGIAYAGYVCSIVTKFIPKKIVKY